jgi:histidinol-phosphate phosphatase family protein
MSVRDDRAGDQRRVDAPTEKNGNVGAVGRESADRSVEGGVEFREHGSLAPLPHRPTQFVNPYLTARAGLAVGPTSTGDSPQFARRAVFVDRDGTLNPDLHYLSDAARVEVFRGVGEGLRLLRAHGLLVVCVTNQSGIERGFYTAADVDAIHARINALLAPMGAGVDRFYYCPHAPGTNCRCRKPGVELFERAKSDLGVDFGSSAIIGDRSLDVEAGETLGLLTLLVPAPGHEATALKEASTGGVRPDVVASSFRAAALHILHRG